MNADNKLMEEVEALRRRMSALSAATLRISASLEFDKVLQEVVDSARMLTGARYGLIIPLDNAGQPQDFVTAGMSAEEHRRIVEWPDGPRLFEHFRDLPDVLRIADIHAFVRSLDFSPDLLPSGTYLGMPLHHQGVHVGNFYLVGKEGGTAFTDEDEEVLVLFASQAAGAIANARTYRAERLARADLEALVDTSPVGVAVFDAKTGALVLINREARRIGETLQLHDHSPQDWLNVISCRRADGREVALDQFPLSGELVNAELVRAEEIVLSTPEGCSVTALINATPIRVESGAVESVVVTLQDLAPLKQMDRMRAEFLSMVSHELRVPLTSIKGSTATVLTASPAFGAAEVLQFFRIIDDQADHMSGLIADLLDAGRIDSGMLSVSPEPAEVGELVERARSTFLGGGAGHDILINLAPDLPRVMADRRRIEQVLNNLFSNAARYSPESAPIRVTAVRDGVHAAISVSDEGRGVAPENLAHLFSKYTGGAGGGREAGTLGAGLGLAICKGLVEAHGGRIRAESGGSGQGTRITFTIPVAEEPGAAAGADRGATTANADGGEPIRILVVDDDPQTLYYIRNTLIEEGFDARVTGDPGEVSDIIRTERPALVLLDLMLSGADGIELMETTPELADLPVIFISGYRRDETVARALEGGAADYIVKPFSPTELIARIRAALRRWAAPGLLVLGELTIDHEQRRVTLAGRPLELTVTEYNLLRVLSLKAGRVLTYDALLRQVWGGRNYGDPKLVRAFVKKLRKKLGDDANAPTRILTERGVGYRMARPGEE